jgi:glycosyltransferase involved in cell wall biosynthesis
MDGLVDANWTFDYQESVTPQYRRMGRRSPLQKMRQPRLEELERKTLRRAGRVVYTAESNRRAYIEAGLVEESHTAHVPYFYDNATFGTASSAVDPDFEVVYFGSFDWSGARTPETFLRSLARFLEKTPSARPKTRFSFYGNWLSEHDRFVRELGLADRVSIHSSIGYADYLEKLKHCPVLLLVVAPEHDLFMPSKIVDYFGAARPIMAFVPRQSEMRRVLEKAGMAEFASDERDVDGGARALARLWKQHQAGKLTVQSDKTTYWSSETQIPRYVELIRNR